MIDKIKSIFDVDTRDIDDAAKAAEVEYPDELAEYYFLASCVQAGRNFIEEVKQEDESFDSYDNIREFAQECVPSKTYATWRLWLGFGRETDAYDSLMGEEVSLSNLESVASIQLYEYASRIIYSMSG